MDTNGLPHRHRGALFCVALCFCLAVLTPLAYAQGVDLALVINGSGSISAADFVLQKEGIVLALNEPLIFPRDGSVSFMLLQYANDATTLHIPLTNIGSDDDVANLVAAINNVVQIGGCTNPGDGIEGAMVELNAHGDPANDQIICLSTDGMPNCGANVATALANAKTSPIGLDRFTVIAIEDPPNFYEADFHAYYDPLVFGGGTVTVAKNSTEYANILGATCLPADLELIGLEAVQTVQDWDDGVPLIANKRTYVRAHIQTKSVDSAPALARLRGFRGGVELAESPLTAENAATFIAPAQTAVDAVIEARRADLNNCLYFRLPKTWLHGTVALEVEGVGPLDCLEAADAPNNCRVTVDFLATDRADIKLVRVRWTDSNSNTTEPTKADIKELYLRLNAIYPVDQVNLSTARMTYSGDVPPTITNYQFLAEVNSRLSTMRFWDFCWPFLGCNRRYYGVLLGDVDGGLANDIPGSVSSGRMPDNDWDYGRNRHAHEIAHTLGIHHAVNQADNGTTVINGVTYKVGYCNSVADLSAPEFPYVNATIGPLNQGQDNVIFGLDTHTMTVVDPNDNYELMSYCGSWRWISDFTYKNIRSAINSTFVPIEFTNPQEYIVARGKINVIDDTVEFQPFGTISSPMFPPTPPAGDYSLQMLDSRDSLIAEVWFQPELVHPDLPAEDPGIGFFIIPIPYDPDIKGAALLHGGFQLGTTGASPNPPTVSVVYPNGGEFLSGPAETMRWIGNDADGDSLTFMVQFTDDGGINWRTLVSEWPDETFEVDIDNLGMTTNGYIRVMASDGFHAVTDISDGPFSTPNIPPDALIISPKAGDMFIGVQPIHFEGVAFDVEDGHLSGSGLSWTSDVDGSLGTGELLYVDASTLTEGKHLITLTATDSHGASDSKTVEISVYRLLPTAIDVAVDIKPGSCPNPMNIKWFNNDNPKGKIFNKGGVLPVAILGTDELDVNDIDVSTLLLAGVAPVRHSYEDVAAPADKKDDCDCSDAGPDGIPDLTLKFRTADVAEAIGEVSDREVRKLTLTGQLMDGRDLKGVDCVIVLSKDLTYQPIGDGAPHLGAAIPNPFNPVTRIPYYLPEETYVTVTIYDVQGKRVERLVASVKSSGHHVVEWRADRYASGIYFYRMSAGTYTETRKVILLK